MSPPHNPRSAFRGQRRDVLLRFLNRRVGVVALVFLAGVVLGGLAAPLIAPYNPEYEDLTRVLSGPTTAHLLGTDDLGRDVFSRLLYGERVTLLGALEAVLVFSSIGLVVGVAAGYLGDLADRFIMSLTDIVLSIPVIIVLLVVAAVFTGNLALMLALGVFASPSVIRVVRASTLEVKHQLYVTAAETIGLSKFQVLRRHVLPRVRGPLLVQVTVFGAAAVGIEAALGYLGLDTTPPAPSWGSMVAEASQYIVQDPWLMVPSGGIVTLTVLALGLVGDAIRESTGSSSRLVTSVARRGGLRSAQSTSTLLSPHPDGPEAFPANRGDYLLSLRDLVVTVASAGAEVTIVDHVCLDVSAGEAVGVVGESGCGKTMTALAVLGLLPAAARVRAGSIRFAGEELARLSQRSAVRFRGSDIGFISQEPLVALDPSFTVGSQLREVIRAHSTLNRKQARRQALELLAQVRLPDPVSVSERYPFELSGGMAQRVCIALALAGAPKLLIADEPTTALDVTVQAEILDLLQALRQSSGMSILLVTHDWGVVADFCDRTAVMYAGQIVEESSVDEIFASPMHPYSEALLASNPHFSAGGRLPSIRGTVPSPQEWSSSCRFADRCSYATAECRSQAVPLRVLGGHRARCLHAEQVGLVGSNADA